ncbi:hypothetical protein, partial [Vibrio parahaemolyticus]|uniref:hypothetical protein n=1 Tax=Vibrio parahaemolyticus TaxID=670 RepID=UPI001A8F95D2
MNQICENAKEFLSEVLKEMNFDLTVEAEWTDDGCVIELSGPDSHIARAENGEMLDAIEVILFQIFGRDL